MKGQKTKKKGRVMWGFIYVGVFRAAFSGSAVVKMTVDPTGGKYASRWDDSVGTVYTDLPYGEGEANKFDLYAPADKGRESYGLVIYLHAGGLHQRRQERRCGNAQMAVLPGLRGGGHQLHSAQRGAPRG